MKTKKNKDERELEDIIIFDRHFLSSSTDKEFLDYESKRLSISKKQIMSIMKQYGYFSDNNIKETNSVNSALKQNDYMKTINHYNKVYREMSDNNE